MMEFLIPVGVFVVCIAAAVFFVIASKVLMSVGKSMKGFLDDDCASTLTQINEVMTVTKPTIANVDVVLKSANEDLQEAKKIISNVEDVTGKAVRVTDKIGEIASVPGKMVSGITEKLGYEAGGEEAATGNEQ